MIDCSWDAPGANRFEGPVPQAVEKFSATIPKAVRQVLRHRLERFQYDEVVEISRDKIVGVHEYTDLRSMLFGNGKVCKTVTRTRWSPAMLERGMVFCETEQAGQRREFCLILPTVCGNLAMVTRGQKLPRTQTLASALPDGDRLAEDEDLAEYLPQQGFYGRGFGQLPLPDDVEVPGGVQQRRAGREVSPAPVAPLMVSLVSWPLLGSVRDPDRPPPDGGFQPPTRPPQPVPEPGTTALIGAALLALAWVRRGALPKV